LNLDLKNGQKYKNKIFEEIYKDQENKDRNKKEIKTIEDFNKSNLTEMTKEFNDSNYEDKNMFFFPKKYNYVPNKIILYEHFRLNGDIIDFYQDNVIRLTETNKKMHLILEDGAILTNFANNYLRLILPNGDIFFDNKKNNSFEINYDEDNYSLIRYLGGYVEKLFFNGIRINKNSTSRETITSLLDDKCWKMFNNNGKLLRINVKFQ